jgi:hypothetical protein
MDLTTYPPSMPPFFLTIKPAMPNKDDASAPQDPPGSSDKETLTGKPRCSLTLSLR